MNLYIVFVLAFACQITTTLASLPHTKCNRAGYKKLGCYGAKSKPLDELLITDRDPGSDKNDGHRLNWNEWQASLHSLVCRCAEAARKLGFTVFGIQNYGECWSGPDAEMNYARDGASDNCVMTFQNPLCDVNNTLECAGKNKANYVYSVEVPKNECSKSPCKNGATCIKTAQGFRCVCTQGFTGVLCDQDVDECTTSPCKNGATCTNTVGGFTCKCQQGFQGKLCDQDVDECTSSPCKNGATCTNTVGGFTCKCQHGFQGNLCDQDINECDSKPCQNGATCVNTPGNYLCKCKPGYTGTHCEQDVDECKTSPCKNGATCSNTFGGFTCKCESGFQGKLCDQDINECNSKPCKNGGTCVNTLGGYSCKCKLGYTGTHCEQVLDPCQSNPCQNGGSCEKKGNGFKCKCDTGFTGTLCKKDVNECQTRPCRNGATCVNTMGSFHCLCPAGFQGKLCEQGFDVCSQLKPCKNGAKCQNQHGGFKCLCPAGITGMRCDLDVNECQQPVCSNGGTCVNTLGSFECICKSGYSGKHCEKGGCSTPANRFDLGLVIDGSGSVGNYGFVETKMFLLKLIDQFTVSADKTHFGIIVYSDNPELITHFKNPMNYHPIQLKLRILSVELPDGKTRTDKALKMAGTQFYGPGKDREQVPNVLVVITDGNSEPGSEPYKKVLKRLKDHNVTIIAVGIGDNVSKAELTEIAMGKEDHVLQVKSIADLTNYFSQKLGDMIKKNCETV